MKLTNNYYLVRHGECVFNVSHLIDSEGAPENHLTEKGREQVVKTASELSSLGITFEVIISSPIVRAIETAEILLENLEVKEGTIKRNDLFREVDFGPEMQKKVYKPHTLSEDPYTIMHTKREGGESNWDARNKMQKAINWLENMYRNAHIVIVSHGLPIWMFYSVVNKLSEEETQEFKIRQKDEFKGFFIKNGEILVVRTK